MPDVLPAPRLWSDNDTAVDALNVQHLVQAVLGVVHDAALTPVTVGVFGPWGSGKSSVARMVRASLERAAATNPAVVTVYFNGWRFEGYEDAKAALAAAILEAVEKRVRLVDGLHDKAKHALRDMWGRVHWLRVGKLALGAGLAFKTGGLSLLTSQGRALVGLGGDAGSDDDTDKKNGKDKKDEKEGLAGLLRERVEEERAVHATIRDFDEAFEKLLALADVERLVVIIDDLDRCLPDRVIDTLEAIRLFLSVKGAAFVISADEALIQHAVAQRFPEMEQLRLNVGRDYLQKMIQVPVRVPPLAPEDVGQYVAMLFAQRNLGTSVFEGLCANVRQAMREASAADPAAYERATFTASTAERFLGGAPDEALREDLALGAQIAPVLALSAQGNPRLIKRFLNALMLRLLMAGERGVALRRDVAAKLLLVEYFAPELFEGLALSQARQGGLPAELARLEREARQALEAHTDRTAANTHPAGDARDADAAAMAIASPSGTGVSRAGGAAAAQTDGRATEPSGTAARGRTTADDAPPGRGRGLRTERHDAGAGDGPDAAPRSAAGSDSGAIDAAPPAWAVAAKTDPWVQAWHASDPPLAGVDLRPYVYFARERLLPLPSATARMSPLGLQALRAFLAGGKAAHAAGAGLARTLPRPDVFSVFADLADRVRRSSEMHGEDSLLYALFALTEARPELLPELASTVPPLSVALLEPRVATRLLALAQTLERAGVPAVPTVRRMLLGWEQQSANPMLAAGTRRVLPRLDALSAPVAQGGAAPLSARARTRPAGAAGPAPEAKLSCPP